MRALEAAHRARGARAEDAVGGHAEAALQQAHAGAAGAHAGAAADRRGAGARVAVQAAPQHPPGPGADHAVGGEPVPALEALDGVQRAAPEDAVVAEVQRALELGHGAAAIAVVQRREGLRARDGQQRDGRGGGQAADVGGWVGHRLGAYGVS